LSPLVLSQGPTAPVPDDKDCEMIYCNTEMMNSKIVLEE